MATATSTSSTVPPWVNELFNNTQFESTTQDPFPKIDASYKWAAVAGGIAVVIFIAAVAVIIIKAKQKHKQQVPPAVDRWKAPTPRRCSSIPDKPPDTPTAGYSPSPAPLPHLEYRDPADLIQDYKWYAVEKPQDDSDVLNITVPPVRERGAMGGPPSPKKSPTAVSFADYPMPGLSDEQAIVKEPKNDEQTRRAGISGETNPAYSPPDESNESGDLSLSKTGAGELNPAYVKSGAANPTNTESGAPNPINIESGELNAPKSESGEVTPAKTGYHESSPNRKSGEIILEFQEETIDIPEESVCYDTYL